MKNQICAIEWRENRLILLDQRILPLQEKYLEYTTSTSVAQAIREMVVRGAPAIGITAAYALVLAAKQRHKESPSNWKSLIQNDITELRESRPTAVNLHWALARVQLTIDAISSDPVTALLEEARRIHQEDLSANMTMGKLGAELLPDQANVVTLCNTGSLATGGFGTALGVIRAAHQMGKIQRVYAGETRPWLQGSRLTAWELSKEQIPVTLLCDSAVASLFSQGHISWVIVGADRIAANGDVANKIGTYSLAVLARHHGVKLMVVAPMSTFDPGIESGLEIPVEHRHGDELLKVGAHYVGTAGVEAWNPVFDITPADLIDVIVTEKGAIHKPTRSGLNTLFNS